LQAKQTVEDSTEGLADLTTWFTANPDFLERDISLYVLMSVKAGPITNMGYILVSSEKGIVLAFDSERQLIRSYVAFL